MSGCTPHIDWSVCDESTGFSRVLPAYFVSSAVVHGAIGVLYLVSMAQTLRGQLREKRKYNYNTAMQMHVGIMASSFLALCYDAALVTREPGLPALPLLFIFHLQLICVTYATTVLVRHWAVLYQRIGKNQPQLTGNTARLVQLYRDGEVIEGVLTCSFFFGSVVYGVKNHDSWERVERLQFLVWAIVSGVTCWLVTILGHRVHVNMRNVSRSRATNAHVRRVYYVAVGSSLLWCQSTICFALGAALDRPLSLGTWLAIYCGINVTGCSVGALYYLVIGSKVAAKAARAIAAEYPITPGSGVEKFRQTYRDVAKLLTLGATTIQKSVTAISDQIGGDMARVYMSDDERTGGRMGGGSMSSRWTGMGSKTRSSASCTKEGQQVETPWIDQEIFDEETGEGGCANIYGEDTEGGGGEAWETPVSPTRRDEEGGPGDRAVLTGRVSCGEGGEQEDEEHEEKGDVALSSEPRWGGDGWAFVEHVADSADSRDRSSANYSVDSGRSERDSCQQGHSAAETHQGHTDDSSLDETHSEGGVVDHATPASSSRSRWSVRSASDSVSSSDENVGEETTSSSCGSSYDR